MGKHPKTNAVRLVEAARLPYEVHQYEYDENDLAATHVAEALGQDIRRIFKTLVLRGERTGLFVCVVPGDGEVDLKKAAVAAGDKKADLIAMKELLPATGYIRGGCSPIGMKKPLPTFFHTTALDFPTIYVSAGVRGMQIEMNPQQLIDFVGAEVKDLVR
ncbi:MAG: Cys-tRNA(Pro) deacylase [Muribaculaceae bacterium]|nr:Cys-tRNA(Pro) deacylase [Muribaculaceae bacterium]